MKVISLAMLVAGLSLTFIACNRGNSDDKKPADQYKPVASGNAEGSQEISDMSLASADSARSAPPSDGDQQAGDQQTGTKQTQRPPQTSGRAGGEAVAASNPDWDKKIVKTANLSLEVKNFKQFDGQLNAVVRRFGGYIAQEQQTQSEYRIENSISIKVPVAQFDDAVGWLSYGADSNKIMEKKVSSEDVTMEVVDTKSRMESKREVLQRYMELLRQAKSMNEILKVQHEIDDVQGEIEGAQGRISYLGHASALSTINLQYYQVLDANAPPKEVEPSFVHKIRLAFAEGWNWVSSLLLALISLWPLGMAGLFAWMLIRRWRSSHPKSAVEAQQGTAVRQA